MPGDKLFIKKQLILGDMKVLNAPQPFTFFMILTIWGITFPRLKLVDNQI
jgi:hypothetical protein